MDDPRVAAPGSQGPARVFRSRWHPNAQVSWAEHRTWLAMRGLARGRDELVECSVKDIALRSGTTEAHAREHIRRLEQLHRVELLRAGGGRGVVNQWRAPRRFSLTAWIRWRETRIQQQPETQPHEVLAHSSPGREVPRPTEQGPVPAGSVALEVGISSLEKGVGRWNAWVGGSEVHHGAVKPERPMPFRIVEADLATREGVDGLFKRLCAGGWMAASAWMREVLHALVVRARRVASNACAFVAGCVRRRLWKHPSEGERAEARREIAALEPEAQEPVVGVLYIENPTFSVLRASKPPATTIPGRTGGVVRIYDTRKDPNEVRVSSPADLIGQVLAQFRPMARPSAC